MTVESESWPAIVYGTAWKEDATAELTRRAMHAGYRAFDTANQPRHYSEAGVGDGVATAMGELGLEREELFLQTKFTPPAGQGNRMPYDRDASTEDQVEQSLRGSLENIGTRYLDSYLLHGPQSPRGMTDVDWRIWAVLEAIHRRGDVRRIGISNIGPVHLRELIARASITPAVVQNRCFARNGWDYDMRAMCAHHGVAYQGFSLLTANPFVLADERVRRTAARHDATPAQIVFAFARAAGMIPLTGTTDARHMADDLAALDITLDQRDVDSIAGIAEQGPGPGSLEQ